MGVLVRRLRPVLGALLGCALGFGVLQLVTTGAFTSLEARQTAQDADRIRIGTDQARAVTAAQSSTVADLRAGIADARDRLDSLTS